MSLNPAFINQLRPREFSRHCFSIPTMKQLFMSLAAGLMMKLRYLIQLSCVLTTLGLLGSPSQGEPNNIYINNNCDRVPDSVIRSLPSNEQPWFHYQGIFYRRQFTTNNQTYWLYAATYTDGAAQFCISKPNFRQPAPIRLEQIDSQFIQKIEQKTNNDPTFLVRVREGQNTGVPFIDYQLNLSNPSRPIITLLQRGCCVVL